RASPSRARALRRGRERALHRELGAARTLREVLADEMLDLLFQSLDVRRLHAGRFASRGSTLNPPPERIRRRRRAGGCPFVVGCRSDRVVPGLPTALRRRPPLWMMSARSL